MRIHGDMSIAMKVQFMQLIVIIVTMATVGTTPEIPPLAHGMDPFVHFKKQKREL